MLLAPMSCFIALLVLATALSSDEKCQDAAPDDGVAENGPYGAGEYPSVRGAESKLRVGRESIMQQKAGAHSYGSCGNSPPKMLRWGVDRNICARICCKNRHYAEHAGYWKSMQQV